jgi:hypothetical protein
MRSVRFFDFSDKAPDDFKADLQSAVGQYDSGAEGVTYTPYVYSFLAAVLAAVQTGYTHYAPLDSTILGPILMILAAANVGTIQICQKVSNNGYAAANNLIATGTTSGFFNHPPSFPGPDPAPPQSPPTDSTPLVAVKVPDEKDEHHEAHVAMLIDAARHRLLGRR